jgi:aryl carrier-like protein
MPVLSVTEYAAHRGVGSTAVSNYIARGQISSPALLEDGRIDSELADDQLAAAIAPHASASAGARGSSSASGAAATLLEARASSAQAAAERDIRKLNAERGRYVLAKQQLEVTAHLVSEFVNGIEQGLPDLGDALGLDRVQMMALRKWWRDLRTRYAAGFPEFIEDSEADWPRPRSGKTA